jgi:hypothetical protein
MLGLKADDGPPRRRPADEPETIAFRRQRIAELREGMTAGGLREAAIRSLIYVGLGHGIDERHFAVLRRIRERYGTGLNLQDFKRVLREQFLMLVIDEAAALASIPSLLPDDAESRAAALAAIREVIEATGEPGEQVRGRLARIESMFAAPALPAPPKEIAASRRKPAVAIPARPPVHHS